VLAGLDVGDEGVVGNPVAFSWAWLVVLAAARKPRRAAQSRVAVAASIRGWSAEL